MPRRLLAAVAAAIVALSLVNASAAQADDPLTYVALGDSYSAASGVLPVDPTASPLCLRSTRNYPHVIAAETGARGLQTTLNDAVRRAAAATGATYVDLSQVSEGHDACQPLGVRWIEPVLHTTNPVVVHPNALGEANMAAQAMAVLGLN